LASVASVPAQANQYTAFGRARVLAAAGDVTAAAAQYGLALTAAPDSQIIAQRAFRQGMAAGDLVLARRAIGAMGASAPFESKALLLADAVQGGDPKAIQAAIDAFEKTPFYFVIPVARGWTRLDPNEIDPNNSSGAVRHLLAENRAMLLIAKGDIAGGADGLRGELGTSSGGLDLRYSAAELLIGQGRGELAGQLLLGPNPEVASVRSRLAGAKPSPQFGLSRLFTRIAADLNDAQTTPIAVTLTRAALVLDPQYDRARIVLAGALDRLDAYDRALGVLDEIGPASAFRWLGRGARIEVLRDRGDMPGALAAAKALVATPDSDAGTAQIYGNLLLANDRPLEAAAAFETARDRLGVDAGWSAWLQIGAAYDKAGRWPQAKAAYEKAIALGPDKVVALNQYGYALVERGEDMPRAVAMLEKANTLAPNQPSIGDSLGWAYFRQGQIDKALPLLEAASIAAPSDADIAEHLGDVYWAAGRRYEARYAWRSARLLADEPKVVARIDAKLLDGPPAPRKS